jgi:hypothetical protein
MDSIFTKLNYKEGQTIYVLNQPDMFEEILATVSPGIIARKEVEPNDSVEFVVIFTTLRTNLEEMAKKVTPRLKGDATFWLAYPKGTSKKYKCDFNRDTSWEIMAPFNLMPVRQVSIDDDWSALRFRKTEFTKRRT